MIMRNICVACAFLRSISINEYSQRYRGRIFDHNPVIYILMYTRIIVHIYMYLYMYIYTAWRKLKRPGPRRSTAINQLLDCA